MAVYGLIPADEPNKTRNTNLSFTIDGKLAGTFANDSSGTGQAGLSWWYNVRFFSISGLPQAQHVLQLSVHGTSLALLDYFSFDTKYVAIYTLPKSS